MASNNKKVLFNKNHIMIWKEKNTSTITKQVSFKVNSRSNEPTNPQRLSQVVKCESALGFYYYKTIYLPKKYDNTTKIAVIEIYNNDIKYTISYILYHNGNTINTDLRPWEVYENDKAMPDHFINALKEIIDNIISIIIDNKMPIIFYHIKPNSYRTLKELKDKLYVDLFGSEKGIRFQTDAEKIISHGFDIKTSFRK